MLPAAMGCVMMVASWYGYENGTRTASGVKFNPLGMTAASKTLPFGTRIRVSSGGRTASGIITDRGPYVRGRGIDLSLGMARAIGMEGRGIATIQVCVEGNTKVTAHASNTHHKHVHKRKKLTRKHHRHRFR